MHCVGSCSLFIIWFQPIFAMYQIQVPEVEFLSKNLRPIECIRFYKLLRRQTQGINEDLTSRNQQKPYRTDCNNLLNTWLTNPEEKLNKAHENVELTLRQIGRTDLAHWLGYNVIHQRQLGSESADKGCGKDMGKNMAVRYKGDDHLARGSQSAKFISDQEESRLNNSTQTVLQKIAITLVVVFSMTTLCLCCYKFLYGRMRGGHFNNLRREIDEESWLQQDQRQCGGGSGTCCGRLQGNKKQSLWNSVDSLKRKPSSAIEYLKSKFKWHANYSRGERSRKLRMLIKRLEKTCPTQRKIIHLNRKEQNLLKSLTDAEKHELPATESDLKFLVASDREKKKLLAREGRREFLIELRKRLEKIGPDCKRNMTLNETERKLIRRLSSSERMLLPIMDKDLELMMSSPLEKRGITLRQMACKLAGISHEDRKYLEIETGDKNFLKDIDDKEKKKLGLTDSEFRFLVASKSQKNVMQQRLESCERNERIKEIYEKLADVNFDVSRLELSKIERSSFLSLNSCELARIGITEEHVKFYAASDTERKVLWPSPSQHRNLRINTLQTKLSKLPWKDCTARLTCSEHTLLASLTPREQDKLHISDSERNFMLSTDSEKELIQRRRKIERLEAKIRDFNTVTMTESERGLILSLSASEMQMLNIDSTNRSSILIEKKSHDGIDREIRTKIVSIKDRIQHHGLSNVRLTDSERRLIESLRSNSEIDSCDLSPSQLSFLLTSEGSERRTEHRDPNGDRKTSNQCIGTGSGRCPSSKDMQMNTSPHVCHQGLNTDPNCHVHFHSNEYSGQDDRSNFSGSRHKVQFKEPETRNAGIDAFDPHDHRGFAQESTDDSGLSETYDELGMLFSQQMKQQARPCQRKYCLLGRHLRRGSHHDERQCQSRYYCCRGYPSDQRPSCSSGNVCRDTYDELQLMRARPQEKKELSSSMFQRRKQFLDQPCHKCSRIHDDCMKTN